MVGSSGALVAAYDKYAQENHGSREPLAKKITVKKHIFSNGELFHGKVLALTPKQLFEHSYSNQF
jgi:hypothetical protein